MSDLRKRYDLIFSDNQELKNVFKKIEELLFKEYANKKLIIPIGESSKDGPIYMNLASSHGIFVGGTTDSGKSVFVDTIISLLMIKNTSEEVKFLLLDPKKIELGEYNGLNYVIGKKSVTSKVKCITALEKILKELEKRTNILIESKVKNIDSYNKKNENKFPHIFVIVDEASDLMKNKDIILIFEKILDYGKPVGIHMILSTNMYLKEFYNTKFLKHFKYRISFDMASTEQSKYIEIDGANLLNAFDEAIVKSSLEIHNFHDIYLPDNMLYDFVKEINKLEKKESS